MLFRASSMSIALLILFLDIATISAVVDAAGFLPRSHGRDFLRLVMVYCERNQYEGSNVQKNIDSAMNDPKRLSQNRVNGKTYDAGHQTYETRLPSKARNLASDYVIFDKKGNFVTAITKHTLPNGKVTIKECERKQKSKSEIQKERERLMLHNYKFWGR